MDRKKFSRFKKFEQSRTYIFQHCKRKCSFCNIINNRLTPTAESGSKKRKVLGEVIPSQIIISDDSCHDSEKEAIIDVDLIQYDHQVLKKFKHMCPNCNVCLPNCNLPIKLHLACLSFNNLVKYNKDII